MSETIQMPFLGRFHFELWNRPYPTEQDYLEDCFTLVSAYLALGEQVEAEPDHALGFLSGSFQAMEAVQDYLADYPPRAISTSDEVIDTFCRFEAQLFHRLSLTPGGENFRLERLRRRFELEDFTYFCLLCTAAAEFDRGLQGSIQLLQGDCATTWPTMGLLVSLFGMIHPIPELGQQLLWGDNSKAALLFQLPETRINAFYTPVALHPHVLRWLTGRPYQGASQWGQALRLDGTQPEELLFCEEQLASAAALLTGPQDRQAGHLLALAGPDGCGKKLTLRQIAHRTGRTFLVLPLAQLDASPTALPELLLWILLEDCVPCLEHPDFEDQALNDVLNQLLTGLRRWCPTVVLLARRLRTLPLCPGYLCRKVEYRLPDQGQAVALWQHFAAPYSVEDTVDWRMVSGKFILTPGQIQAALHDASLTAGGGLITAPVLRDSILRGSTSRLGQLADCIQPFYDWDDLILDDHSKQMLRDVCNRIKYKYQVEEQWGFKKKSAYGNGISVLLYGPPGTGKTMSAQVLAHELWLPLYRINLAQIISKYIGETAKNLDVIFNEARSSNVILFFDEADALFSKRTDIQNSNDRHSNSEISYLLQKIEDFNGISILATNLANHFDEAFRRRIQYMINIHMPSEEQRMALWKRSFPPEVPLSRDIDFALLAASLEFSGSVIKSAALQAAYFAADEGCKVGMSQIVRAVRAELTKLGKPEPHCLQLY